MKLTDFKGRTRRHKPYVGFASRFSEAVERHEAQIARHTFIQSWIAGFQLFVGSFTTAVLIYIAYLQYVAADLQYKAAERQVALEYARIVPLFSVSVSTYGRIPIRPPGAASLESAPTQRDAWSIGISPSQITGDKSDLAHTIAQRMAPYDSDYFYRRLISDEPFAYLSRDVPENVVGAINEIGNPGIVFDRNPQRASSAPEDASAFRTEFPRAIAIRTVRGEVSVKRVFIAQDLEFAFVVGDRMRRCTVRVANYYTSDGVGGEFAATTVAANLAAWPRARQNRSTNFIYMTPKTTVVEIVYADLFGNERSALFSGTTSQLSETPVIEPLGDIRLPRALLSETPVPTRGRYLRDLRGAEPTSPCRALV